MSNTKIDLSRGSEISFTYDGIPAMGRVVASGISPDDGMSISFSVITQVDIPDGSHLVIEGGGGCGKSAAHVVEGGYQIFFKVVRSAVDLSTIDRDG
jgi:hypothetical protein